MLSLYLLLVPSSSKHGLSASWALRSVKLQTSREDSEHNFSHVSVWQCQCLSVTMSLAFITTSLFPGTSPLVPQHSARTSFSHCGVCARIRSLLFTRVAHSSSFFPASFFDFSPFGPVFTPLHFAQQLNSSCFPASCVNTVRKKKKKSVSGSGKEKFRVLGRGLKSMSVGVILSNFSSDHM